MTLTITEAVNYPVGEPPRVLLTVLSTESSPNPVPVNSSIVVWRIHPDGSEHRVLTPADPRVLGGGWAGFDYHSPYNVATTYRVDAAGQSATVKSRVACNFTWLIHPYDVTLSVRVDGVRAIGDRNLGQSRAGRFEPIDGLASFISDGSRSGITSSILVKIKNTARLEKLLADDTVILVNTQGRGRPISWMWANIKAPTASLPNGGVYFPFQRVALDLEQSADPDVDQIPTWNDGTAYAAAVAAGLNDGQRSALYANDLALSTNTKL